MLVKVFTFLGLVAPSHKMQGFAVQWHIFFLNGKHRFTWNAIVLWDRTNKCLVYLLKFFYLTTKGTKLFYLGWFSIYFWVILLWSCDKSITFCQNEKHTWGCQWKTPYSSIHVTVTWHFHKTNKCLQAGAVASALSYMQLIDLKN